MMIMMMMTIHTVHSRLNLWNTSLCHQQKMIGAVSVIFILNFAMNTQSYRLSSIKMPTIRQLAELRKTV